MRWAAVGCLYVRNVRSLTTKSAATDLALWFLTSRGDGSIRYIARHDPGYDRKYPTRYEDEGYIGFDDDLTGVTGSGSVVKNQVATNTYIESFIRDMVTPRLVRPDSLPIDRWIEMGLRPREAERIQRVWKEMQREDIARKMYWEPAKARIARWSQTSLANKARIREILEGGWEIDVSPRVPCPRVVLHTLTIRCGMCDAVGPITAGRKSVVGSTSVGGLS